MKQLIITGLISVVLACAPQTDPVHSDRATEDPLYVKTGNLWSSNLIRVCWENPSAGTDAQRQLVRTSVANTWEAVSKVRFTGWGSCTSSSRGIRIRIRDEGPHTKGLGDELDGRAEGMVVNFTFNTWSPACRATVNQCIAAIAVHEFGHALGFAHEQNRPDTPDEDCADMEQGTDGDTNFGVWDLSSIMNYCNPSWNNGGALSQIDIGGIQEFYGIPEWTIYNDRGYGWTVGDFDGDGKDDLLREITEWGGAEVFRSTGTRFELYVRWTGEGHRGYGYTIGDFDGDGKTDLLRQQNEYGGAEVMLSTGSSFAAPQTWNGHGHRGLGWIAGDFNGDGMDDIARHITEWGGAEVLLSNGSSFGLPIYWTGEGHRGFGYTVGDFNGDGRDDLLRQQNVWGGAEVMLSNGSAFDPPIVWTGNGHRGYGWFAGDFDGNGRTDIFRHAYDDAAPHRGAEMLLSSGSQFVLGAFWNHNTDGGGWKIGDFNGDGRDDVLRDGMAGVEVFLSDATQFLGTPRR